MERRKLIPTEDPVSISEDIIVDIDRLKTTMKARIKCEKTYLRDLRSQQNRLKADREDSTSKLIATMEAEITTTAIRIEEIKSTISLAETYNTGGRSRCF
jgi:hypothetical protein